MTSEIIFFYLKKKNTKTHKNLSVKCAIHPHNAFACGTKLEDWVSLRSSCLQSGCSPASPRQRLRIALCKATLPQPIPSGYANFPQSPAIRQGKFGSAGPGAGEGPRWLRGSLLASRRHSQKENSSLHVENGQIAFLPPKSKDHEKSRPGFN